MAFTTDYTEQCGQPADLAQLEERHDHKGSETYMGSSPVIGIGKGLRFRLCQKIILVITSGFYFLGVSAWTRLVHHR